MIAKVLFAILGLGVLMAVHETGHFLLARLFKMRVLKFSIGFGPVLWSKKPRGSATTYQIALLPFLAYVQIDGMNPFEESDPKDKGSYANASWIARFLTIIAGPLANYLAAVVAVFALLSIAGEPELSLKVAGIQKDSPAAAAQIQPGDEFRAVAGKPVQYWSELRREIQAHKGQEIEVVVQRGDATVPLKVTPRPEQGTIGVEAQDSNIRRPVSASEAAKAALVRPPLLVAEMLGGLYRIVTLKESPQLAGVVKIGQMAANQFEKGWDRGVDFFVLISISICVFNLLPFPALDGGRLAFLLYEFVARRKPDAKVEAKVHMAGLLALLTLMVPILAIELWQMVSPLFVRG
jgi:regulator of sigma E protease